MKPFTFILIFVAAITVQLNAQKIQFSIAYKPNTVYTQTSQQTTELKFESAAAEIVDALKEQGIQNPISNKTETVTTTGAFDQNKLPLVMKITKSESDLKESAIAEGTTLYGHVDSEQKLKFDSVSGLNADAEVEEKILEMVKGIVNKVAFSDTTLKIGDSVSVVSTTEIPSPLFAMKMVITTWFKLLRKEGNTAYFDVTESYTSNSEEYKDMFQMTGHGKGTLQYDIANRFYKIYKMDSETVVNMKMGEQELKISTLVKLDQSTIISR
jgi:hypothetical protein